MSQTPRRPSARFIAGDPLRAVAALSVVSYHYGAFAILERSGQAAHFQWYLGWPGWLLGHLDVGLFVFFALTGYLISRPFVAAYADGGPQPPAGRYLRNRLLRIVPAFWVVLTVLLLIHGTAHDPPRRIVAIYGFAQSVDEGFTARGIAGPMWTLGAELGFYLLVPLAALGLTRVSGKLDRLRRLQVVIGLSAVIAAGSLAARAGFPAMAWRRTLPALLFAFMPGVALGAAELLYGPRLAGRTGRVLAYGLLLLAGGFFAAYVAVDPGTTNFGTPTPLRGLLAALATGSFVAAPMVWQWATGRCWRVLDNAPLRWLGERSYSIYLIHQGLFIVLLVPLAAGAADTKRGFVAAFAVGVPAVIAAAYVSHRLVERPALERRLPWRRRPNHAQLTSR